jgi:hypothetical protein
MSFSWKKVGSFNTAAEAENWYRSKGIAHIDARIDPLGDGVELSIREGVVDREDEDPRPYGY